MRCVEIEKPGSDWVSAERTRPRPGPHDLVVRVLASGVCFMDVRQARGEMGDGGRIPGHEFVGEVVALGAEATGFGVGDRVGVTWHQRWCRSCPDCVRGRIELCRAANETGIYLDGGHAEYALVDAGSAVRIDSALDPAVAATLLCSGYVAYSGLVDAAVRPGDRVAVVGFGGIGHLATQYARAFGAEVTVLTTSADKESDARRLGAEHVVVADADQLGQPVPELGELDAALLTSEHPGALMTAVHALAPYGRLVAVAAPVEPVPLVLQRLLHYKLTVAGASQGPRHRLAETFDLHRRSGAESVVQRYGLDDAAAALDAVATRQVRYRAALIP